MKYWRRIFGERQPSSGKDSKLEPEKFRQWVKKGIELIGQRDVDKELEELQQDLIDKGIPEYDAGEILIFLPSIFCKRLFPNLGWLTNYIECYSNEEQISMEYSDNWRYVIMEDEVDKYWRGSPDNQIINNISIMSSEFGAINKMLKDGGKIEDVKITESYVIRY